MKLFKTLALTLYFVVLASLADETPPRIEPTSAVQQEGAVIDTTKTGPSAEPETKSLQIVMSKEQIAALGIKTGPLQTVQEIPLLQAPAKVIVPPNKENLVSAMQGGLVTKIAVAIGDKVSQGQILAQINSPDLLALQRQYLTSKNDLRLAESVYQRDSKMADSGIIPDSRLQESRSRLNKFSAEANETRQLLKIAGMTEQAIKQLETTRQLNSQLTVASPISGVVLESLSTVGRRVDNQTPLFRIADITELWLQLNIPQEQINDVHLNDKVYINNSTVTAAISLLGQSVNEQSQTVAARAVIIDPQNEIRPGQTTKVSIVKVPEQPAFQVPNEAIAQNEGQAFVFIQNDQGFLVRPATIVGKQNADTFITGDLTTQDSIALRGAVTLKANWLGLGSED